jgi:hypothetical protein
MVYHESPLSVAVKGLVAGLAGTGALTVAMKRAPVMMQQLGLASPDFGARGTGAEAADPTQRLAERVATGVLEKPLQDDAREIAAQGIHWGYGAAWGVVYGLVQGTFRWPTLVHGTCFGGLVATVASTVVPALGLTPPPTRQPLSMNAMQVGLHLLYGWVTALAFRLLSRA